MMHMREVDRGPHPLLAGDWAPLTRTERMVQDSYVLDFLIGEMDGSLPVLSWTKKAWMRLDSLF
jgi:hypothetical protein